MEATHFIDSPVGKIYLKFRECGGFSFDSYTQNRCFSDFLAAHIYNTDVFESLLDRYDWEELNIQENEVKDLFMYIEFSDSHYGDAVFKLKPINKKAVYERLYFIETPTYGKIIMPVNRLGEYKPAEEIVDASQRNLLEEYLNNAFTYVTLVIKEEVMGRLFLEVELLDSYYGSPTFRLYPLK